MMEHQPSHYITYTSTMVAHLKWTIKNFGSIECKKETGEWCKSPSFHAPGDDSVKWHVKIYPKGEKKDEFNSFYVLPESPMQSGCLATIIYTLSDAKSEEKLWSKTLTHHFEADCSQGWGFGSSVNMSSIENLVVGCKLEYQVTKLVPFHGKHSDLATDLSRLFSQDSKGDVTFVLKNKEFPAHKFLLSARSPVFAAMFQHDMKEAAQNRVDIVDIDPDIFHALLRFMYTDQVDLTTVEKFTSLLSAADRYHLDLLKWKCEQFLVQALTLENCAELLMLADAHNAINLKEAAVKCIGKSPAKVMKTEEWKKMKNASLELVCETLETLLFSDHDS